ncbi:MAG: ABC transporter ATP-binding protein, partial [bacterium]|nr:ABC transporter ATP-binding protein [bacterium]
LLINLRIRAQLINAFAGIVAAFVGMIAPFVVLWYGVSEIIRGNLSLGTFVAFSAFQGQVFNPAQRLTNIGYTFSQAMAGLERIYELFHEKEEDKNGEPAGEIHDIVFENVNFSYNGPAGANSEKALDDFNLRFKKGQRTAVVGESGQGKTTMLKMILKFYQPDSGRLCFSGVDSRQIAVKSLRRKIAYISQKQRILEDELQERLTGTEARSLLKKFRLDKDIDNGEVYQTEFSGGEVQKIELMESALREADVLIVDEGTSNIDYNSEKIVLNELIEKYKDKIIIFIAHRLSSVTAFERIVVMDKGSVAEQGTHSQLLKKKGKYHFLWGTI